MKNIEILYKIFTKITKLIGRVRGYLLFGNKCYIGGGVKLQNIGKISVGNDVYIAPFCVIKASDKVVIGSNCSINEFSFLSGNISIGDGVRIANKVSIHSSNHTLDRKSFIFEQGLKTGFVVIEDDVWIGTGVSILKDVKISRGSVVGAGSVVTKSIEPYQIVAGNPAKKIGTRE
jgi:acetyltransferase-like isoleucine patch superfamily enzyme